MAEGRERQVGALMFDDGVLLVLMLSRTGTLLRLDAAA